MLEENSGRAWPEVDVDIRPGLAFDALPALQREDVDVVISSDLPSGSRASRFTPLFDYEPVFVAASAHPLAAKPSVEAEDFRGETLITPIPSNAPASTSSPELLTPAKVEPRAVRQVELTAVIPLPSVFVALEIAASPCCRTGSCARVRTSSDYRHAPAHRQRGVHPAGSSPRRAARTSSLP